MAIDIMASLSADWQRQWGSRPSALELQTLVDQYVHDEIFYQAALALAMDRNDVIGRRRLIQKMEFLAEDVSALREPEDEVLQTYLEDHRDRYQVPGRVSFSQVYLSRELRGDQADTEAQALLQQLLENPNKPVVGDRSMLPGAFTLASFQEMAGIFGTPFARDLGAITTPGWHGPFRSAYGTHLVNVSQIEPGHGAMLAEVRSDVRLDWLRDQRQRQDEQFYEELRDRHDVVVDTQALEQALPEDEA